MGIGNWERARASVVLLAALLTVVASRSSVFVLPLLAIGLTAMNKGQPLRDLHLAWPTALRCLLAFVALGLLSALWAPDPLAAVTQSLLLGLAIVSLVVAASRIRLESDSSLLNLAGWSVIGFSVATAYLLHEVLSNQTLLRWILNTWPGVRLETSKWVEVGEHVAYVSDAGLKWSIAALNLMLWPILAICLFVFGAHLRWAIMLALVVMSVVVTFAGTHTTSQMALLVAAAIFALSLLVKRRAGGAIAAIWVVVVLGALPVGFVAKSALQAVDVRVGTSFGPRIEMWEYIAAEWVNAPVLGIGARGSYARSDAARQADTGGVPRLDSLEPATPPLRHPHNVYLQVWLELGLVGAVLFLVAGYTGIRATKVAAAPVRPFLYAAWAAGMVLISSTWDLWQSWFVAMLATAGLFCLVAVRLGERSQSIRASGVTFSEVWLPGGEGGFARKAVAALMVSILVAAAALASHAVAIRSTISAHIDALAGCASRTACGGDAERLGAALSRWSPYSDASPYTPFRILIDGRRLVLFNRTCREIPRETDYFSVRINPYDKTLLPRGSSTLDASFRFADRMDKIEGSKAFVSPQGCVAIVELQTDRFIAVAVGRYDVAKKEYLWRHVILHDAVRLD